MQRASLSKMATLTLTLLLITTAVRADPPRQQGVERADYPKRSPFAALRWQGTTLEVKVGEEWFKLLSLDQIPAAEIVRFSQRMHGDRWRKRVEEDLVQVLTEMGNPPADEVTLMVQALDSGEMKSIAAVPMTEANRWAIWEAAQAREKEAAQRQRVNRTAVSIDNPEQFRRRVDQFLDMAHSKTGFSGVVLVARGGEAVIQEARGWSRLNPRTPNRFDTPFRIASLSKQFTAGAILSLESEGKLSTDDPVHRYLDEFANPPYDKITIHHLLTHRSGLPRNPDDPIRHARWDTMAVNPTSGRRLCQTRGAVHAEVETGREVPVLQLRIPHSVGSHRPAQRSVVCRLHGSANVHPPRACRQRRGANVTV